jgi:NodT family efflux transporter outer membrane factor (OMF) lipoprotein
MTAHFRTAVACATLLLSAGCEVGPSFRQPDAKLPPSWQDATQSAGAAAGATPDATTPNATNGAAAPNAVTPATSTDAVDQMWWRVFQDPTLEDLEQRVATQNLDVRSATLRLTESRRQLQIISGYLWPTLDANASYEREKASKQGLLSLFGSGGSGSATAGSEASGTLGSGAGGAPNSTLSVLSSPLNLWQYGFDASWELDLWGGARRAQESARATAQSSQEDLRTELLEQMAELARDYLTLRGVQAQRAIVDATVAADRDTASITGQRAGAGIVPHEDLVSAEAETDSVASQLPALGQQEAQLINALSLLLGLPPDALRYELVRQPSSPSSSQSTPPTVPLGLPSELARRRPDIRSAEARLQAATAQVGVAVAELYPSITLTGSFGLQALQFSNLGSWSARQYALGPSLTLPLFEGGRLRGTVELRKVQQQEAAINYQKTVLTAWHDVANALIAYSTEQERLQRLTRATHESEETLRIALERYRSGIDPYLNVLTAQRTLLQYQLQTAQSLTTLQTNLIQLYKALGGGWESALPETASSAAAR